MVLGDGFDTHKSVVHQIRHGIVLEQSSKSTTICPLSLAKYHLSVGSLSMTKDSSGIERVKISMPV